jgi:hypothetical protein
MDIELFNQLPVGSHLARRVNGQYTVSVRPLKTGDSWQRFIADTPDEAIKEALEAVGDKITASS